MQEKFNIPTTDNSEISIKDIYLQIIFLLKKKYTILTFLLIGTLSGYLIYLQSSNKKNIIYKSSGLMNTNVVQSEIIIDLIKTLNQMDISLKAKKMNIPINSAASIKYIAATLLTINKTKEDILTSDMIQFHLLYQNIDINRYSELIKGMLFYINSNKYIQEKKQKLKLIQKEKTRLLKIVNNEMLKIDKINSNIVNKEKSFNQLNYEFELSNVDLIKTRQNLENQISNPIAIEIIDKGYPTLYSKKPNLILNLILFSILGIIVGVGFIYFRILLVKLKNQSI